MDEDSMKIAVCGESFCTASKIDVKDIGTRAHFSHILEDRYGHEVIHLAHGGVSNVCIWFQIREAIKLKPQVIVYNKTWSARIELLTTGNFYLDSGLKNFIYYDPTHAATGSKHVGDIQNGNVLSTVWQGLAENPFVDLTTEQLNAVKLYIKHMYHDALHTEIDSWVFEYWHNQIVKNGIFPVCFNDENIGKIAYDFSVSHQIDSPFHTDRATQEIIAANIDQIIKPLDNATQNN